MMTGKVLSKFYKKEVCFYACGEWVQEVGGDSAEIALGDFSRETLRVSLGANFVRLRSRRTHRQQML